MICVYCRIDIVHDEPGWGFNYDSELGDVVWHTECFELEEETVV